MKIVLLLSGFALSLATFANAGSQHHAAPIIGTWQIVDQRCTDGSNTHFETEAKYRQSIQAEEYVTFLGNGIQYQWIDHAHTYNEEEDFIPCRYQSRSSKITKAELTPGTHSVRLFYGNSIAIEINGPTGTVETQTPASIRSAIQCQSVRTTLQRVQN